MGEPSAESGPTTSELQENRPIDKLSPCLEKDTDEQRQKKLAILKGLSPSLITELHGHLQAVTVEEGIFFGGGKKNNKEKLGEEKDKRILRGKLFEMLVEQENAQSRTPVSEEILGLMHNPDRFGLARELGLYRNPDLAFVKVDEVTGRITIEAAGEAKLGRLDYRSFRQFETGGFIKGFQVLTAVLNGRKDLADSGLRSIAGKEVILSDSFKQILIVPSDRRAGDKRDLIKTKDFRRRNLDQMVALLDQIEIKENLFFRLPKFLP